MNPFHYWLLAIEANCPLTRPFNRGASALNPCKQPQLEANTSPAKTTDQKAQTVSHRSSLDLACCTGASKPRQWLSAASTQTCTVAIAANTLTPGTQTYTAAKTPVSRTQGHLAAIVSCAQDYSAANTITSCTQDLAAANPLAPHTQAHTVANTIGPCTQVYAAANTFALHTPAALRTPDYTATNTIVLCTQAHTTTNLLAPRTQAHANTVALHAQSRTTTNTIVPHTQVLTTVNTFTSHTQDIATANPLAPRTQALSTMNTFASRTQVHIAATSNQNATGRYFDVQRISLTKTHCEQIVAHRLDSGIIHATLRHNGLNADLQHGAPTNSPAFVGYITEQGYIGQDEGELYSQIKLEEDEVGIVALAGDQVLGMYKRVDRRVKPVPGAFPEDARVEHQFPEDPLKTLPDLSPWPPDFKEGNRLTDECLEEMHINEDEFLWPEEERLFKHILSLNEEALAFEEAH